MTQTVRVNVRAVVNMAAVRKEKRSGRDMIIVPSATMPDDIVMNGSQGKVLYPADVIAKTFKQLERTPAPLGHPIINGKFVSAKDPEAMARHFIGAWNENVRQENGRVLVDKVIDVEVANRSEGGKAVLAAIEAGGPVHTSSGFLAMLEPVANVNAYTKIARSLVWDHDAILLTEDGAATPDQGVGMLVNSAGENEDIIVINSSLADEAERDMNWALDSLARAVERRQKAPALERIKTAIMEALGLSEREPSVNRKEDDMAVSDEQFKALSDEVKTLSEALKPDALATAIGNAVATAVKPLTDAHTEVLANQKAADDAELTDLVSKIVKANVMEEAVAKELTLNAARALAKKAVPGKAAALNSALGTTPEGDGFKLPAGDKKE